MEHLEPGRDSDPRDHLSSYGRGELSWNAVCDDSGLGQDPFTPSGTLSAASSMPTFSPVIEGLDFLQDSLETIFCKPPVSSEGAFPELPQNPHGRTFHTELPPPESLTTSSSEKFWLGSAPEPSPESQKHPDQTSNDATQALFWASIFQAQQCVLDLQGEIDRKKEPPEFSSAVVEEASTMAMMQDWAPPREPFRLDSDSEEDEGESSGRQGEEIASLEEEEMDHLFYNNPLFQENPSSARAIRFEGPGLFSQPEGQAIVCGEEEPSSSDLGCDKAVLFYQTQGSGSPLTPKRSSVPELYVDKALCPLLSCVPHCRSLSPLVIMEGGPDEPCPPTEAIEAQSSFPDQQTHPPSVYVAENMVPGASHLGLDLPAGSLLFSPSRSSLTSVLLLQEPPEIHPPYKPPLPPPAKATGGSSSSLPLPAPAWAEWSLGDKGIGPRAPSHSHHGPSCAWAGQPSGTSSPLKEVAAQEPLSSITTLDGSGRKLGSSSEGFARLTFPVMPGAMEETLGNEEEEEEEEEEEVGLPRPQCIPDGDPLSNDAVKPEEALQADSLEDPSGKPLFSNGGAAGDQASALRLATRLYHLDGFKRSQVAAFLQKNNEFSQKTAEAYLSFFEFGGQTLDQALRSFLKVIVLTGETQERERILWHFSQRYHHCNSQAFRSPDAVHTLTCAIMLLNTDLHGQNIGRSMSCQAFLANLEGLNDGQNFPKELLKALYSSIHQERLEWAVDEDEVAVGAKQLQLSAAPCSRFSSQKKSLNPFLSLAHNSGAETYRQGLLARKVHAEADGKKTPWGKRGWKIFHTVLKGMVLYFFKEESQPEGMGTEEPIGVHHALAEPASKYNKRPHVFRLQTADWCVFLFQAPSAEEMSSWVSRINLVAAMFSSPPFPAAVGSQRKFFRPILPTAPSKNSLEEQHEAHESCLDKASNDLLELQRNLPDRRGVRGRDLEEYRLRKEYLLYEKRRYETYVRLLEVRLSSSAAKEDLDQWEARLAKSEEEGSCPSLQKSHSSPSLNAEGPVSTSTTAAIKVKRNISERRTVRRIIPRRNKHLL